MIFVLDRILDVEHYYYNGMTPTTQVEELRTLLSISKKDIHLRREEEVAHFIWKNQSELRDKFIVTNV